MADRRLRVAPPDLSLDGVITASNAPLVTTGAAPSESVFGAISQVDKAWSTAAWAYYQSVGPLNYSVNWRSQAMSRIALNIAEVLPGLEPQVISEGPAVEILNQLKWDESAILADASIQLDVPGRGYLVGTEDKSGQQSWLVYSSDQVRVTRDSRWRFNDTPLFELHRGGYGWEPLDNSLVVIIRDADLRYRWRDTSTTKAALTILREIDLYDKEIISSLVSRIANNGILLVPSEVSFPSRESQVDNEDPFVLELIEAAKQAIKDPGSASAAIPLPLRVPAQFIPAFRHLTLSDSITDTVINARREALNILADTLNLPREIVVGMGQSSNHWSAFQISEDAIQLHIKPTAELICGALTSGFLYPQLKANKESITGPNGGRIVVWYDTSALVMHPDLSSRAVELYDRVEISADALRRETGFTQEDAPDNSEIREQLLKKVASNAQLALTAIAELTGTPQRSATPSNVKDQEAPTQPKPDGKVDDIDVPEGGQLPSAEAAQEVVAP